MGNVVGKIGGALCALPYGLKAGPQALQRFVSLSTSLWGSDCQEPNGAVIYFIPYIY